MQNKKAAFLDRDGVINVDRRDFTKSWDEFVFCDGTAEALAELKRMGFLLVVVTNQSCIGRGIMSRAVVDGIHERMQAELEAQGAAIDQIYVCPHAPEDGCDCRKPRTGSIERAVREHGIDIARSFMAGDAPRDIEAGAAVGLKTIFIRSSDREPPEGGEIRPDKVIEKVRDLPSAVKELGL